MKRETGHHGTRLALLALLLCAGSLGGTTAVRAASSYYTVVPCRLLDTRNPVGAFGGPALAANSIRTFQLGGRCQTSPTASAVSVNVTVTQGTRGGHLSLYAGGTPQPNVSTLNFRPNQTRANNALVAPGIGGGLAVFAGLASGSVHMIIDVTGYFDNPANNQPPQISAGVDQTITLPGSATLSGTASDDGKPGPTLTHTWTKISGPGTVTFGAANALSTTASFGSAGSYVLRLSVSDSQITTTDELTVIVNPVGSSSASIARFLEQATFGPTDALIDYVQTIGVASWLNEQFNLPPSGYLALPLMPATPSSACNASATCLRDNYSMYPLQRRFFVNALYSQDQLRQRVAWALHELIVVSGRDITLPSWMEPYLNILQQNAFGNYRQLLHEITLNPAMGNYLDMVTSTRTRPNENYAREILQLFSIGTVMLNPDGTPKLDGFGIPIPSYDQAIVDGFSKVFTGWTFAPQPAPGITNYRDPMRLIAANHDTGEKDVLPVGGIPTQIPAGLTGDQDLSAALDNIFYHPNVGPYVATALIHSLVTSNPSPAYVGRVSAVFDDNGAGVRGDLRAVVEAILLDNEAWTDPPASPNFGHLKEPVLLATNFLRSMNVLSANRTTQSDGHLNQLLSPLDQDVQRPPTVFSYYPADFVAPNTALLGPEFGIYSAVTAFRRANLFNTLTFGFNGTTPGVGVAASTTPTGNAPNGTSIDLAPLQGLASVDISGLLDELNRRFLHGTMSLEMKNSILTAVAAVPSTNPLRRAQTAIYLVATSSQYQVGR